MDTPAVHQSRQGPGARRRFWGNASGASALEFSLVALPFFLLLLAVLEVGLVYFVDFTLDSAVYQASRLVRTGQAQNQNFDASQFKAQVCNHLVAPINCAALQLDVRHYTSFSNAASNLTNPLDANGNLKSTFSYDPGVGGDIVVVQAFYEWDLLAKMPKQIGLSNLADGNRLFVSIAAFRNEPFTVQ